MAGGRASFLAVDLAASYPNLRRFATEAVTRLDGRLDVLVNNAGIYPATATPDLADADLDVMLAVSTTLYVDGGISATRLS